MGLLDRVQAKAFSSSSVGLSAGYSLGAMQNSPLGSWSFPVVGEFERIGTEFADYVEDAYKSNGIVFACILARMLPFSEARFQFQQMQSGRPGRLFGTPALSLLEAPWANGTTGDLLARMEQKASLAGNFYATPVDGRLRELRPDWVTVVSGVRGDPDGSPFDINAEILGYIYHPRNVGREMEPVLLSPDAVVHYAPIPDPAAQWRGMSWLTPVLREIEADSHATEHKRNFFRRGASLNVVVTYDKTITPDNYERYVELFDAAHTGSHNAYKTLHLGGGADAKVVGTDLKQIDFKAVQGAGETRIAAAAGVPASIVGISEGLAGSALNAGNYTAARRRFADATCRPLWRSACSALSVLVPPPDGGSRLWFDDRDVSFLQEDVKDEAEIRSSHASTIRTLVEAGFDASSVVTAVTSGDFSSLVHTGLLSVQLQEPGAQVPSPTNGAAA